MSSNKIFLLLVGIFALLWLVTGGLVVISYPKYSSEFFDKDNRPLVLTDVKVNAGARGVPYLFGYAVDSIPYSISLKVFHHDVDKYQTFEIEKITVTYVDGEVVDLMPKLTSKSYELPMDEHVYIDEHKQVSVPSRIVEINIPDCVSKKGNLKLMVVGKFLGGKGVSQNVSFTLDFDSEEERGIYGYWYLSNLP